MKQLTIDAHQHVWNLRRARYDWLGPALPELNRTFEFDELRPQLRAAKVTATVLVQAADNAQDTDYMFDVAAAHPEVVGVVAWLPLDRAREAAIRLAQLQRNPLFVGVRSLIHDRADPDWLLRPEVDEGLSLLEAADVPFDLVALLPRHLELVPTLSARHPRLRIVIDHLGSPPLRQLDCQPWWSLIARAAENPQVFGKVSGLYPVAGASRAERIAQLQPAVNRALGVFGADRLMVGSDWPVSTRAGGYRVVHDDLTELLAGLDARQYDRLWNETVREFYRLSDARLALASAASAE